MKKIIMMLFVGLATATSVSAMNLKDAFTALSNIQNVSVTKPDFNLPIIPDVIDNLQIAAAYNLNQEQILESGNAAYTILNQVPLTYMINGGNNNEVAAFVYATPNESGTNNILLAAMSGYKGSVVFLFGTVDDANLKAIQNAPLHMEGNFLSIEANMPDGNEFNIIISKAR